MRVCLVTGEYPPRQGGVADYTRCLAGALADEGLAVDVFTGRAPGTAGTGHRSEADAGQIEGHGRVTVYRLARRWGWSTLRALERMVVVDRPDVLHIQYQTAAYGMHPAINAAPWWLRTRTPVKVAFTYHDLRVPYLLPKAGPLRRAVTHLPARTAHLAVVTNEADHTDLVARTRPWRLELVPIGSNIADTPPAGYDRAAWRAAAGLAPDTALVAYFGFLNRSKGGRTLLEALARLRADGRDVRLVMIGGRVGASDPTNAAYLAEFEADIVALGLVDAVTWTGHVSELEVSAWLRAADAAALPYVDGASYRRGSLLAALAHGVPVVTTRPAPAGGALPALADGEAARLVPPEDPAALATTLAGVLDDPALAARLSAGAREVARHFGWPAIAARHAALYREILAGDG